LTINANYLELSNDAEMNGKDRQASRDPLKVTGIGNMAAGGFSHKTDTNFRSGHPGLLFGFFEDSFWVPYKGFVL